MKPSPLTADAISNGGQPQSIKRRPGRPRKSTPLILGPSQQGNTAETTITASILTASPKRRRRRKRRGHTSDEDDGKNDAIRLMKASNEFADDPRADYGLFLSAHAHGLPLGSSAQSEADDWDTEDATMERLSQRKPMTAEEREKYWVYNGPPTIRDSFFRTSAAAAAAVASEASLSGTPATAISDSPLSSSFTTFAFGHKISEALYADHKDFSIAPLLSAKEAEDKGIISEPLPAKAITLSLPKILIDRAPSGGNGTAGALGRIPRASSTRASTPNPINGFLNARSDRHRRAPRIFRSRPTSLNTVDLNLKKKAIFKAAAVRETAANVFDSDGELSSVLSDVSDSENHDSDTKFRLERATRHLDPSDAAPLPSFLSVLQPASPALSDSSRVPGIDEDDGFYIDIGSGKADMFNSSLTDPQPSPAVTIVNGMRVRKRVRLDEFPTNELLEVDDQQMAALRIAYENASGKRVDTLGPAFRAMPLGEWQIKMVESDMRGS